MLVKPSKYNRKQTAQTGRISLTLYVDGEWSGWSGDTIVQLTDGSVWRQDEYHYSYHYSYRPKVEISNGKMLVKGMNRAIRVRRLS
jgi:hypothetical protein